MRISDWSSDVCSSDLVRRHMEERMALGRIGMAALDQPPDHGDHLVNVRGGARRDIGRRDAKRRHVVPIMLLIARRHDRDVDALGGGGGVYFLVHRSEERRFGKGCVRPCGSQWSPYL